MSQEEIVLKSDRKGEWWLHAPLGHAIAGPFRGSHHEAVEWGTRWISSFNNWTLVPEGYKEMKRKIDCMNRLFDTIKCRNDILDFLKEEKLITDDAMQTILHEHHTGHATRICGLLADLQRDDKLQLVDYEWTILPKELVKLTLVSRNFKREFVYNV